MRRLPSLCPWRGATIRRALLFVIAGIAYGGSAQAVLCGYVANEGDGSVSVVDLTARAVVQTVTVGQEPTGIAITRTDADGTLALVVNRADATLSVLSLDDGMTLPSVPLTTDPAAIAAGADGIAYVIHPDTANLTTLDIAHSDAATALSLPGRPVAVGLSVTPPLVLVVNEADSQLLVLDDAQPPLLHPYRVGTMPTAVAVAPDSGLAYVGATPLTVVDPKSGEVKGTVSLLGGNTPAGITVIANPSAALLCVKGSTGGGVFIVPTNLTLPRSTLELGAAVDPAAIMGHPSIDNMAFVTDRAGDQLLFVDLTAGVVGSVATGDRPGALAVAELDGSSCWPSAVPTPTVTPPTGTCVGDCSGDGEVAINELIVGVTIALGSTPASQCPAFDANGDGQVVIAELISAVGAALNGCS